MAIDLERLADPAGAERYWLIAGKRLFRNREDVGELSGGNNK